MGTPVSPSAILLLGNDNADGTQTGVTTGTSISIPRSNTGLLTFVFQSVGTTSGGTILVEEAWWPAQSKPYTGTYSQMQSVSASSFTGSAQYHSHFTNTAYGAIRVRISSDITGGGKVLVWVLGQSA